MTNLEKAIKEVQDGLSISGAAMKYRISVDAIREAMGEQVDEWGHKDLRTFIHRNSFANAARAVEQYRSAL